MTRSTRTRRTAASFVALFVSLTSLATTGRTQSLVNHHPPEPTAGYDIEEEIDVPWIWSDGYQVLLDIRHPVIDPGPDGWPLIVLVHGGGGNRGRVRGAARDLARAGYLTLAYDVRGQGPSMNLNPATLAHDMTGLRELIDLFEAMEAVESLRPALTDFATIGVTGYSQGGTHSWWAAMHSGRTPPANPWRSAAFPVVSAVVVKDSTAGSGGSTAEVFNNSRIEKFFGSSGGFVYQPAILAAIQAAVLAEDYAGLNALSSVPGMDKTVLLPLTDVPVYAHASYDDKKVNPSGVFASYSLLHATTPKRFHLGTGGHDSPKNDQDDALYERNRQRWFDRFLKNQANGVDTEPLIHAAVTPEQTAAYLSAGSLWDFRSQELLPETASVQIRAYLGAGGSLDPTAAVGASSSALDHVVPAGLDIAAYTSFLPNAAQLETMIPLDVLQYDSAPLTQDRLMQGEASVELEVDASVGEYQVHAALYDVDPAGNARWVSGGQAWVRGTPGANRLNLTLYLQSYVFRTGHRVRLQLDNLVVHRPPTGSAPYIKWTPYFTSSIVDIFEGGPSPSFIDLPILPYVDPTLSTYPLVQSVGTSEDQRLAVHTHTGLAGAPYLLLPTLAGTAPGTLFGGVQVPIQFDALTWAFIANPAMAPFVNGAGNLDATGRAGPEALFGGAALPTSLIGTELSMAVYVGAGGGASSNAVTVPFRP